MNLNSRNTNISLYWSGLSLDKVAVEDLDNNLTYNYRNLDQRANTLANYLVEKCQVYEGDRIAFCARNCIELIDGYYATAKTRTVLTTYNPLLSDHELTAMINNEKPKVFFYEDIFKKKIERIKKDINVSCFVVLSGASFCDETVHYEDIFEYGNDEPRECEHLDSEDIHLLIHTGGTTGVPKAAMISYRALLFNVMSEIATLRLTADDSAHILSPFFHTAGWNVLTLPLLFVGGKIMINKCFDPVQTLGVIRNKRPTTALAVPTMLRRMQKKEEFYDTDFSSLRWILSGAAPTPLELAEEFWGQGIKLVMAYGMTEAGPNNLSVAADDLYVDEIKEMKLSVGKPMHFNEMKIVDKNGDDVKVNEYGELLVSGPLIFSGYWNNEEETNRVLRDGWVYTGDIAVKDEKGNYTIVGRKKNMYITGGENIFPSIIEGIIYEHPAVYEVCVVGVPDKDWGEVGKAVVSLNPTHTLTYDDLKEFMTNKIGTIEIPRYLEVVESLPKNAAGKIKRSIIKERYGSLPDSVGVFV